MDANNKAFSDFITAAGVLAETSKVIMDALLNAGFSKDDALYLTGKYVSTIIPRTK